MTKFARCSNLYMSFRAATICATVGLLHFSMTKGIAAEKGMTVDIGVDLTREATIVAAAPGKYHWFEFPVEKTDAPLGETQLSRMVVEIKEGGEWVVIPFQVERWRGTLFEQEVRLLGSDDMPLSGDMVVIDLKQYAWVEGQQRTVRLREGKNTPAQANLIEIRFDDGKRLDTVLMSQHRMPDGQAIPVNPNPEIHTIDDTKSTRSFGKGYSGFSVNSPMIIGMPNGSEKLTTGYAEIFDLSTKPAKLLARFKSQATPNMGDPLVTGGSVLVPYHVFDPRDPTYDLCYGYPSFQIASDVGPLYAFADKVDYLVDGPVRKILRSISTHYFYDANPLCRRPCENTTLCLISGGGGEALRFEYRMAIQGHGLKILNKGMVIQLAGLQLIHSRYNNLVLPSEAGVAVGTTDQRRAGKFEVPSKPSLPGYAFWDPARTAGNNTLTVQIHELFIDAFRSKELRFFTSGRLDEKRDREKWLDWHPHIKVVPDRDFDVGDGFIGVMSLYDPRFAEAQFMSTVYCVSSYSFGSSTTAQDTIRSLTPVGQPALIFVDTKNK
jgi:hypothetical protein